MITKPLSAENVEDSPWRTYSACCLAWRGRCCLCDLERAIKQGADNTMWADQSKADRSV
jgi:hypothetical protein